MWEVEKIQDFCPRAIESCHLAAARRVKLWSLNTNLLFKELQQLTKFTWQVNLNNIWKRIFHFKDLIEIFLDQGLQTLWSYLLTKPDFFRFRVFFRTCSLQKSVTPLPPPPIFFSYISDITNSSSYSGKSFRKKSMLENFHANVLKRSFFLVSYYWKQQYVRAL